MTVAIYPWPWPDSAELVAYTLRNRYPGLTAFPVDGGVRLAHKKESVVVKAGKLIMEMEKIVRNVELPRVGPQPSQQSVG